MCERVSELKSEKADMKTKIEWELMDSVVDSVVERKMKKSGYA